MRNKIQIFGCALKFKLTDEGLNIKKTLRLFSRNMAKWYEN